MGDETMPTVDLGRYAPAIRRELGRLAWENALLRAALADANAMLAALERAESAQGGGDPPCPSSER